MIDKKYLVIGIIGVIAVAGFMFFGDKNAAGSVTEVNTLSGEATIFRTENCGCCLGYANYMKENDIKVNLQTVSELSSVKREYGIPSTINGCHTMLYEGYVIEGHVPKEAIDKLLEEKPDIKGLALPGMPQGSPGMSGIKRGAFTIYSLHHDGTYTEFMKI